MVWKHVEVIANHHESAGVVANATGGVGDDEDLASEGDECSRRKDQGARVVSLIEVHTSLHGCAGGAVLGADDKSDTVSN